MAKKKATVGSRLANSVISGPCKDNHTGEWYWSFNGYCNQDDGGNKTAAEERCEQTKDDLARRIDAAIKRAVRKERERWTTRMKEIGRSYIK